VDTLPKKWSHVNHRSGKVRQPKTDVLDTPPTAFDKYFAVKKVKLIRKLTMLRVENTYNKTIK